VADAAGVRATLAFQLEAENLVLRQQINVLIRKLPKQARLTNFGATRVGLAVGDPILNAIGIAAGL